MNKIIFVLLFFLLSDIKPHPPEWINFCGGDCVLDFIFKEDTAWIATIGGIAKLNTVKEEMKFFNRGNSDLKSNRIYSLALDSGGALWAGTKIGISEYKKNVWTTYLKQNSNIGDNEINEISIDKNNSIWAGTACISTISIFNGTSWKSYLAKDPLAWTSINSIVPDWRGKSLVGTSWGICYADTDTILTDTAQGRFSVTDMRRDSINNIWISTEKNGIYYFDGVSKIVFDSTNSIFPSNHISSLCYNNRDILYAASFDKLYRFVNGAWEFCNPFNLTLSSSDGIIKIESDKKGNIWIGTAHSYCYKWDGQNIKNYYPFNFLHPHCPQTIGVDSRGRCWAGNYYSYPLKDTMIYFNGSVWNKISLHDAYTALDTLSFINICDMDTLKIWVDSSCALVYRKYNWSQGSYYEWCCYTMGDTFGHGSTVKRDRKGIYWYAASYGLWQFDHGVEHLYTKDNSTLPGDCIEKIAVDSSDKLWLSVLNKHTNGDQSWLVTMEDTIFKIIRTCDKYYGITDIEIDYEDNIWFAECEVITAGIEFGHGVYRLNGNNLKNYTISNSQLSSNTVYDLSLDRNNTLWITTYAVGVDTLRLTDSTWGHFTLENSRIADTDITQVEIDFMGNKWFKSHMFGGITVYKKGGIDFCTDVKSITEGGIISPAINSFRINGSKIHFTTSTKINAAISIYTLSGRRIAHIAKKLYFPGAHCEFFHPSNFSSALFLVSFDTVRGEKCFKVMSIRCRRAPQSVPLMGT